MTMVEVITIIATGILCVLCVICIVAVLSSRSQARANSRAIKDIEKSISSFGDSIKQKTDQLIDHIDRQQTNDLQEQRLELLEQEILRISRLEKELDAEAKAPVASATDIDVMAAADSAGPIGEPDEIYSLEEIEELDDEIELDDLFRELAAMGEVEEEEPQQRQETLPQFAPPQPDPVPEPPQPAPEPPQPVPQFIPPRPAPEPPQPAPVQTRHHQGYNIGRSGKKYTAEELNMLIRE